LEGGEARVIFALIKKLLTVDEVADLLRIPKARVYELVRQRKLRVVYIGRSVRIPEEALDELVEKGGTSP
jgi:excisionase family DNA binding protein